MTRLGSFLGWVVGENGKAHALYLNDAGESVYWCGEVFYSLAVPEQPRVPSMDVTFCTNCQRVIKLDGSLETTKAASG